MDTESKLRQAFKKGLGLEGSPDFQELAFAKTEGWDSIGHMKLIAAIEEELGIRLDVEDVLALSSYSAAGDIIKKHTDKKT